MKHKLDTEKTVILNINEHKIVVAELPEDIRNEIATFDRIKQQRMDALFDLEVMNLAFQTQQQIIQKLVVDYLTPKQEAANE